MIKWLKIEVVIAVHKIQIEKHGGKYGIRDIGLLDSALCSPQQHFHYGNTTIPVLAALYAFAIIKNHPFWDSNKRTALVSSQIFLNLNKYELQAPESQKYSIIIGTASGLLDEDALFLWYSKYCAPI